MSKIDEKLAEYCLHGGLYNPESMRHDKVRELLFDCRDEIARLRLTDAERTLIEKLTLPHPDPRMGRSLFVTPDERDIAVALLARHGGGE